MHTHLKQETTIQGAKEAIISLLEFVEKMENGMAYGRKVSQCKGFYDPIWNDQIIGEVFRISSKTIWRRRVDGTFIFFKVGRFYYYHREDILQHWDKFLK